MNEKKSSIGAIFLLALLMLVSCTSNRITPGTKTGKAQTTWLSSTPEKQGVDSTSLAKPLEYIAREGRNIHSLLVIRNGYIILEAYYYPYARDQKHILNSCAKSFVSALVGIAIDKGLIQDEDSTVLGYFRGYRLSRNDPLQREITIKHLLTMTSGIDWPQYGANNISDQMGKSADWVQFILDRPMATEPGSQSNYSNGDAHLLSAIIQKATGETALDFGWENLFKPLGISDVRWDYDPNGISIGSGAMYLTPRDMAKLGYLYLKDGKWEGKTIVSTHWVRASLQSHTKIAIAGGYADYGYYWWIYPRLGLYEAWGGAGQRIGIFPDLNIVTVMTAEISDDAPVTPFSSQIYRDIREAARSATALPENPGGAAELEKWIARAAQNNQRGDQPADLLLWGLIGAVSVILIVRLAVWRSRRGKSHRNEVHSL